MKLINTFSLIFLCCLSSISGNSQSPINYEFRAVWVATVDNIDWPSTKNISVADQKAEFIKLLDMHQLNGMNAVIVQIRPAGDALYPSQYEPWSEFLTGKQGAPPIPYYDPLEFMIKETHNRGMEFHAWMNPYRAVFNMQKSSIAATHLTKLHPEWFLVYGNKKYFNPALPEVRQHTIRVVKDIVSRYDIDAIHMDDYFYPYRIAGKEFPDQSSYLKYGNGLNKEDWRRSNCDSIIKQLYETIRSTNPRVKFGISPFGIWRNKSQDPMGSDTKGGQTNYDDLYADILLWLEKGWVDYVVPQLYWERGHKLADYDVLLNWWNQHVYGRQLYIGHGFYRAGTNPAWRNTNEIPKQIAALRNYKTTKGSVYFNSKVFEKNPLGWNDSLRNNYYYYPALVPPMPWIDDAIPVQPTVKKLGNGIIELANFGPEKIKAFGVFILDQDQPAELVNAQLVQVIVTEKTARFDLAKVPDAKGKRICVASVDRNNNVSQLLELK
ncbi:MAG: family 10 glycosylhydrolase [Bacteroidota bacterium]